MKVDNLYEQIVASISQCVCRSVKKFNIALTLVSWLDLHYPRNVIPQTLINELLTRMFVLKLISQNSFSENFKKCKG